MIKEIVIQDFLAILPSLHINNNPAYATLDLIIKYKIWIHYHFQKCNGSRIDDFASQCNRPVTI